MRKTHEEYRKILWTKAWVATIGRDRTILSDATDAADMVLSDFDKRFKKNV